MKQLSTNYLGLRLQSPIVLSASPLAKEIDNLKQMADAGAGAIVLPSLFEEQIRLADMRSPSGTDLSTEWLPDELQHIPKMDGYNQGVNGYIVHLHQAKKAVNVPIIASLNAYSQGGWARYARILEAVGADALILNVYHLAAQPHITGADIEAMTVNLVREVKSYVQSIPVAIKLSPFFSAPANIAQQLIRAGADGLILFNRFYQPDFNIETGAVDPSLDLSLPSELRLRLRWTAILSSQLKTDFAITGGVHTATDVLKSIMSGASVAMMTSALLKNGIGHLAEVIAELEEWLTAHQVENIGDLSGKLSQTNVVNPTAFERANYMQVLEHAYS